MSYFIPPELRSLLYDIDKMLNDYAKRYGRTLFPEKGLRQLATSSLYRKSPEQVRYIINKLYKKAVEKYKSMGIPLPLSGLTGMGTLFPILFWGVIGYFAYRGLRELKPKIEQKKKEIEQKINVSITD